MNSEKEKWLKSINAAAFPEPVKYIYTFPGYSGAFNLSETYMEDTSLNELKKEYKKNKEYVKQIIEAEKARENYC